MRVDHLEIEGEKLADTAQRIFDLPIPSPGGRLMNLEERSEISVSNSRRVRRPSAEPGGSSTMDTL
jgi:hypothetical protein